MSCVREGRALLDELLCRLSLRKPVVSAFQFRRAAACAWARSSTRSRRITTTIAPRFGWVESKRMARPADLFPGREPSHFVFPLERYGASGDGVTVVYASDPTKPIGRWKEAWETARDRAGVSCRFHDLRHTGCTRMLEAGVPFSVVATIMGWSPSTTVRMSRRYGHIGQSSQRLAVNALKEAGIKDDGAQNWAHSQARPVRQLAN